jgi:hypothetical protein
MAHFGQAKIRALASVGWDDIVNHDGVVSRVQHD